MVLILFAQTCFHGSWLQTSEKQETLLEPPAAEFEVKSMMKASEEEPMSLPESSGTTGPRPSSVSHLEVKKGEMKDVRK